VNSYRLHKYEEALEGVARINMPGYFHAPAIQAAALGQLGRYDEASKALQDLLALRPNFGAEARREYAKLYDDENAGHIIDGLRKAGLEIVDEPVKTAAVTSGANSVATGSGASRPAVREDEGFWVAVLPFKYIGANADLHALADGLTDDIITGMSRFSYLRVISRSSTARYAEKALDVRAAAKELGARYVMEGSLRYVGSKLRIAVQLVDTNSGAHLWAETYDRAFHSEDVFGLQDDVVPTIVSTVADTYGVLPHTMSETLRTRDPEQLTPYESVLRSFAHFPRLAGAEHAAARAGLERAVQQAPGYADAWAMLSMVVREEYTHGFNVQPDSLGRALAAARRAVEIAPANHLAYHALASAQYFRREVQAFRISAERAIALNPMDGFTAAYLGFLIAYAGDWERGCALAIRARQLNPHHPGWYWFGSFFDAYRKRDYRGALDYALKVNMPGFWRTSLALATAYGQLGETQAARNAARDLLVLRPDFPVVAREELGKWWDPQLVEHLIDGLGKAGMEIAPPR
jgi:TolB-like protein/Flp pilus assembly protein TadD